MVVEPGEPGDGVLRQRQGALDCRPDRGAGCAVGELRGVDIDLDVGAVQASVGERGGGRCLAGLLGGVGAALQGCGAGRGCGGGVDRAVAPDDVPAGHSEDQQDHQDGCDDHQFQALGGAPLGAPGGEPLPRRGHRFGSAGPAADAETPGARPGIASLEVPVTLTCTTPSTRVAVI